MKRFFVYCLLLSLFSCSITKKEKDFAPLFPFVISHDAPNNVVNMSILLDAPAGKDGFVRVENGRFVTDAGPIKFNATNLTGPANFPPHEVADSLADRLARFGINCVRFHYFDAQYGNFREEAQMGIFGNSSSLPKAFSADPNLEIPFDSIAIDHQDYLVAALKKRGIYVNMNLHVARFPKGLSFFVPEMITSEKEYAKKLLTRINPYTGLSYIDDPCIAMIEINNENALFNNYHNGAIDRISDRYAVELKRQWNTWLKKKYRSTSEMFKVWNWKAMPLKDEQIIEGIFDQKVEADGKTWLFDLGNAKATAASENGLMKITVDKQGDEYFPKLYRNGIKVKKGEPYTVTFKVRCQKSSGNIELGSAIAVSDKGWNSVGFHQTIKVGQEWTTVRTSFLATEDTDKAQFQLTRFKEGVYELDDLSFKSGADVNIDESQSIERGTVAILKVNDFATPEMRRDFYHFIEDTEKSYWTGIANYVHKELKAKVPISGTQLGYSSPFIQAELDYIDNHSYWLHPGPVNEDWRIGNTAMVNSMGCVLGLASQRVLGKPYTISEYNHPFPNQFGAEGQPLLRAYGALQGWDGVFEYTWHHRQNYSPGWNSYFFSISERTDVLAHMPACAAIFLRGDVHESQKTISAPINYNAYFEKLTSSKSISANIGDAGFKHSLSLIHKTGVDLSGNRDIEIDTASANHDVSDKILISDTKELCWNTEDPKAGYFTVNTANTKLFTGFPEGRTIELGSVALNIGRTRLGWATISLVSKNATGFGESGNASNILLTATGLVENKGMMIEKTSDTQIRLTDWGTAPIMAEGIPATIIISSSVEEMKCFALDSHGERKQEVTVKKSDKDTFEIMISPEYQTIWYEIVMK